MIAEHNISEVTTDRKMKPVTNSPVLPIFTPSEHSWNFLAFSGADRLFCLYRGAMASSGDIRKSPACPARHHSATSNKPIFVYYLCYKRRGSCRMGRRVLHVFYWHAERHGGSWACPPPLQTAQTNKLLRNTPSPIPKCPRT